MVSKIFTTFAAIIKINFQYKCYNIITFLTLCSDKKTVHFRHHKSKINVNRKRYSLTVDSFGKRYFLVAYGKKSLEEIFNKIWPMARNQSSDHRNLHRNFFWLLRKKSLEEIFFKMLLCKKSV